MSICDNRGTVMDPTGFRIVCETACARLGPDVAFMVFQQEYDYACALLKRSSRLDADRVWLRSVEDAA